MSWLAAVLGAMLVAASAPTGAVAAERIAVSLRGSVTDASGEPVAGARVAVTEEGALEPAFTTTTNRAGRFRFRAIAVVPGSLSIRADHPARGIAERTVAIGAGQAGRTIDVSLELARVFAIEVGPAEGPAGELPREAPRPLPRPSPPAGETSARPPANYSTVSVFYATDRKPSGSAIPTAYYTGQRGAGELAYGTVEVSIPRHHAPGELETPSIWRLEFREDPAKHVVLMAILAQPQESFYRDLSARVTQSRGREAFVFVHGYNVTFEDAARRTAQIAYDLKIDAAPILYSWTSAGATAKYLEDEANVEWSTPHLKRFLEEVSARSGATTIHLIAHSMGNRALAHALSSIAAEGGAALPRPRFRQVILAAPDIDAGVFRQLAAAIAKTAERVTLYASSNDEALAVSKTLHGYARAGDSGDGIVVLAGVDTIDASSVATEFLGHSYYGDSPTVLDDLLRLLKEGVPPSLRRLVPAQRENLAYWLLPP